MLTTAPRLRRGVEVPAAVVQRMCRRRPACSDPTCTLIEPAAVCPRKNTLVQRTRSMTAFFFFFLSFRVGHGGPRTQAAFLVARPGLALGDAPSCSRTGRRPTTR